MPTVVCRLILVFVLLVTVPAAAQAQDEASAGGLWARQAIVMDFNTGMALLEKNADEKMPTSSMSKALTAYLVFKALRQGELTLDTDLPISERAWRMGGSRMFVEVNTRVPVEELLKGLVVQSGNDAAVALAEGIGETEQNFVKSLNFEASALGMDHTHLANASGWPDPDHYSTARDLATLSRRLIQDFPDFYPYFSLVEYTYNNIKQTNRNPLLYRNIGADGIKTGHTDDGGYGLMASGTDGQRRVLVVINGLPSDTARAQEGARLLEWGLKSFQNFNLFKAGEVVDKADVIMGKSIKVPLILENDLSVTVLKAMKNDLKVEVVYDSPAVAPIRYGNKIGILRVTAPQLRPLEIPLLAGDDVEQLDYFSALLTKAKLMLGLRGNPS